MVIDWLDSVFFLGQKFMTVCLITCPAQNVIRITVSVPRYIVRSFVLENGLRPTKNEKRNNVLLGGILNLWVAACLNAAT